EVERIRAACVVCRDHGRDARRRERRPSELCVLSRRVPAGLDHRGVGSRTARTVASVDALVDLLVCRLELGAAEVAARADAELREDLVQVPFDGAMAEEQARADLRVGETLARQLRDLLLLRRQRLALVDATGAQLLARRDELDAGA